MATYSKAALVGERSAWTARLLHVPDWAMREELQRRGEEADTDQAVRLPGLTVDPVAGQIVIGGEGHSVRGRMMEVIYALALCHAEGRRRVRSDVLARRVFRGWEQKGALENLRTYISYTRGRFPGLILSDGGGGGVSGYYRLGLAEAPAKEGAA